MICSAVHRTPPCGSEIGRIGALTLGALYLLFALLWVPNIIAKPLVYDRWGNFFEQFSIVSGALIVFATIHASNPESVGKRRESGTSSSASVWFHSQ
jgi:hypothetical protein